MLNTDTGVEAGLRPRPQTHDQRTLRVAIAGLGIAARQILPAFDQVKGVQLVAVADTRAEELGKWRDRFGVETFTSVADVCASPDVDAVWIATPNHLHAEHTVLAADRGKHVICEKPMAVTLQEADLMQAAVERNGVKYVQGHSKIYENPIQKMGEVIASGRLGKVIHINTMNYNDWLRRPYMPGEVDVAQGGGLVYRQGPHQVDIVRFLGGGMVKSVRARTGRWNRSFDCEGDYAAFLDFESGATATLTFMGYGHLDVTELTWQVGEGGRLHTEDELWGPRPNPTGPVHAEEKYALPQYTLEAEQERSRDRPRVQPFFGLTIVSCERGDMRQSPDGLYIYTQEGREEIPCRPHTGRIGDLQELVESVAEDRPSFPDARWARATLETLLAMYESSSAGREVALSRQVRVGRIRGG